jgi:segregation and condensation protein B
VVHEPDPEPGEIVDEWGADDEPEDPIEAARATMYALVESVDAPPPAVEPGPEILDEDIDDEDIVDEDIDDGADEEEPRSSAADLGAALEAILLVVDEPVGEAMLADVLDATMPEVTARLEALAAEYTAQGRGFDLRRAAGGWRLYTRGEYAAYVERFVLDGQSVRLTQAALETLAVIAYQQPVSRSRISAIRGVNCDGVVRTLMTRGLIEECGTQPESGAFLYRTTSVFLEKLGLDSVEDLPPLAPFLPDDVNGLADAQR